MNFGLGNMYDKVETGLVQGLASEVGTHELNPLVVTEDSETKRNSRSVATNLIDGLPTKGLGIECMVQGLAISEVGTQELIQRVGLVTSKAAGISKSVAICMETLNDENGVGTGNLTDMGVGLAT